jgi:predicted aconitase with swiveling domain
MVIASGGAVVDAAESVFDPQSLRQTFGGLLYKGRDSLPAFGRFGARPGVLANTTSVEVAVTGMTVDVRDTNCVINTAGSSNRGPYLVAIAAGQHTLATAHPSLTRIDTLIGEVLDNAADASGDLIPGRTRVIPGVAGSAATPAPDGTLLLAYLTVTAGATTATLNYAAPYTVAAGGILPVPDTAGLPAAHRREGMYADVADADRLDRFSGSAWSPVASQASYAYWLATTGGSAITNWTSYTPTWTGIGSASFATNVGRWIRTGPKCVQFKFHAVISTAGTGSSNVQVTAPFAPSRVMNQTGGMHVKGSPTPALRDGLWESFTSGTGATIDRLLMDNGLGSVSNIIGTDLVTGLAIVGGGTIMEA